MFKSLHLKMVLIMLLLIISLMTVVGAFLINGVTGFFMNQFYEQMRDVFSDAEFVSALRTGAAAEDGYEKLQEIMSAYYGVLGIDSATRNYYILDGNTGSFITGSDESSGAELRITPNILTALNGNEGYESDWTQDYMDVALPIDGGDNSYIIYIRDTGETGASLNTELFMIILEALIIGLIISVLLSFLLSKSMTAPIERLTEGAERMAAGDFERKIEISSRDEIGVLTGTFNDMASVLKNTLEQIENERTKLDTLFLHMTDGVVAFSRDGILIHKNPAAEQMLGAHISENATYAELFGEVYDFDELLALGAPNCVELEHQAGEKDLELYFAPFSGEVNQGGVLVVIHDVTEQKKAEDQRREFVANVSHELRTPLTNVRSYAETLVEDKDLPAETVSNFLNVILSETDRMTRIVQDLLTLSRFDYGHNEMNLESLDMREAIQSVYDAVLMEAKKHNHLLLMDIGKTLPKVRGDRVRIEQVLMNVISNAIKYTPDGGTIKISAFQENNRLVMIVKDNGIGIPKEDLPRIFERFYRVDKARSREFGGTGLGLAIAREIVLQHGGDITLSSTPGNGTEVRIILPVEERSHE